ncbi:MAG: PorV/PorQ family protein [Elusimicrobia bacterium]|nr:PorV/PorQ family protein [Elusimicrobiota bacterium]
MKSSKNKMWLATGSIMFFLLTNVYAGGKAGASFLKISPGAGPAGMGGAYTAMASDINALYYNPAGIGNITQTQIGVTHAEWLSNVNFDFVGGVLPTARGSFGVSAIALTTGEIEGRDESGNKSGNFNSSDLAVMFSGSRRLSSDMQLGGSIKVLRQTIANETANGVALDIGGMRRVSNKFTLGLTVRNFGPKMKFIEEKYSLPLSITTGVSYKVVGAFNLATDISYEPVDKKRTVSFGTEFSPMHFFTLRAGYLFQAVEALYGSSANSLSDKSGEQNSFAGGIGIKLFGHNLDYAVVPYADIGLTQRISYNANF